MAARSSRMMKKGEERGKKREREEREKRLRLLATLNDKKLFARTVEGA